jgi:glycosyltransferase involved in cell wall biosynthesis
VIRVALDTSATSPKSTGIGRYVTELLKALGLANDVKLAVGPVYSLWKGVATLNAAHPVASLLTCVNDFYSEYIRLPSVLRGSGIDVYHAPAARVPVRSLPVPLVVTVHDFAAFELPTWQGRIRGAKLRAQIGRAIERARLIVLPSEAMRQELAQRFPQAVSKARTIYSAASSIFHRAPRSIPRTPTFVSVATLERRKNLATLIDAFAIVVAAHPEVRLRLIGQSHNDRGAVLQRLAQHRIVDSVTLEGYVTDDSLAEAYADATATVYPSLYEGFGLPILESMAAGAPVITSNCGAMREIGGGAALLVDPLDPDSVAQAMLHLIEDPDLRAQYKAASRQHATRFTWEQTARKHIEVYRQAVGSWA